MLRCLRSSVEATAALDGGLGSGDDQRSAVAAAAPAGDCGATDAAADSVPAAVAAADPGALAAAAAADADWDPEDADSCYDLENFLGGGGGRGSGAAAIKWDWVRWCSTALLTH